MAMFKYTSKNQTVQIGGLVILVVLIGVSLLNIAELEDALDARSEAFKVQSKFDDLNEQIKSWVIAKNEGLVEHELQIKNQISKQLKKIQKEIAQDKIQKESFDLVLNHWDELVLATPKSYFDRTNQIGSLLREMDERAVNELTGKESPIILMTRNIVRMVALTALVVLFLTLYAIRVKFKNDQIKHRQMKELEQLKIQASAASELKSKFLATVSHEIRTPLNGIIGLSDVLRQNTNSGQELTFINAINQSGKMLLRIINDILDFSKIESGKIELENTPFSVIDILDQVLITLSPKSADKSVHLDYEVDPSIPRLIVGDPNRLSQILFNLVGNAIKFTKVGSVIIKIKNQPLSSDHTSTKLRFSVEDTGEGISQDDMQMIFMPFVQGKSATTTRDVGTGLGLSISQQLVKSMGGEILVASQIGSGSKFWFEVSFTIASKETIGPKVQFSTYSKVEINDKIVPLFTTVTRPRVLVAEDNPTNQLVIQAMLSQLGIEALIASNGLDAVSLTESTKPELILMDCQMPVMDGFTATKEIRKKNASIPIIAMTANASSQDQTNCLNAGMNSFISKPIVLETLRHELANRLGRFDTFQIEVVRSLESKIGQEACRKVLKSFVSSIGEFRLALEALLNSKNIIELNRSGHRLKSSAAAVGGFKFANLCKEIESAEKIDSVLKIEDQVIESIEALESAIGHYLGNEYKTYLKQ